jgi:hypothetical protein
MSGKLITLTTYDNVPMSEVARLRLEDAGIPVRVENAEIVNTLWHVGTALGGVRLLVEEQHAAAARELIAGMHDTPTLSPPPDDNPAPPKCLACGAEFPADSDRCAACGWSFADGSVPEVDPDTDIDADLAIRAETARSRDAPLTLKLSQVRDIGQPLVGIWVAIMIAFLVMGFLTCALTMLSDMFW